ncbi:hypothetical protein ABIE26_003687 [Pedobacter africanus]|uniref:Uncharacterized protein n=1 Tax=Pedobacter africanus TaxID=151894 RepID=A0ACC6L064_9SPHI|nr:S41 family peptidase [Pedobacter africanus]MDR6784989.1 hypothetical protein [Pedobacter africanus]
MTAKSLNKYLSCKLQFILFLIAFPALLYAQKPQLPVTEAEKKLVINAISKTLTDMYIFPEVAQKMVSALSARSNSGAYDALTSPSQFAAKLAADLVDVSHDQHINISFDPAWVQASKKAISKKDSLQLINRDFPNARADNFGFRKIAILDGNIGYLNLTRFYDPATGGETVVSAMNFLSNADALILDLRQNDGGRGDMVQLIASYFFDPDPVMIVDIYSRADDQHRQDWTLPYVPGKRLAGKPLYVLTGQATFSAAESFIYFLKNRNRAILVGQPTGGGAHPVRHTMLTDRFTMFIPYARPIDPITKTDWEGTGVSPHIAVPEKEALTVAHINALEGLLKGRIENRNAAWALEALKARVNPVLLPDAILESYTGSYSGGLRNLTFEKGKLYLKRVGEPKYELVPLNSNTFYIPEMPYLQIKITTVNGKIIGLERHYNDGSILKDLKDR